MILRKQLDARVKPTHDKESDSDTDRQQGDDADSDHQYCQGNGIVIEPMAAVVNTHDASHPVSNHKRHSVPAKAPSMAFCSD
jgi:hypothetical protein